ncbi:MAG TPA: hypothetical protein VGG64_29010 [Pirellulales bacterium]
MSVPNHDPSEGRSEAGGTFENLGRKLDERPEVQAAQEALRHAQEQLERAKQQYHEIRAQAVEGMSKPEDRKVSDLVATALEMVRKHPGPGVLAAVALGWFAGRIFRR